MPNPGITVDDYLAHIEDFARAYLFKVYLTFPPGLGMDIHQVTCHAKSTNLPDVTTEEVSTFYMGMQNRMSSVRRYSDWQITMYLDKNADLLRQLYRWNALCHDISENVYGLPEDYMVRQTGDQIIHLLDPESQDQVTMQYKIVGAWPKTITNVMLDYESNEFITMDVNFSFQYFTVL